MTNIKVLVATHIKYQMPTDSCYLPIHVGKEGKPNIGYIGDNTGVNISEKNPYFCELTGLYWGWKNVECDYIGLSHYRRLFSNKSFAYRLVHKKFDCILNKSEAEELLKRYDVILPKKRNYYIETLYSHYGHTHYAEHLDETRKIIDEYYRDYINDFDIVMKRKSAHMFNMFIMKKNLADKYCKWLFSILNKLEDKIDVCRYDSFEARLFGRTSELLLDVWLEHNELKYKEIPYIYMEKTNWVNKCIYFLKAKFMNKKFKKSF